MNSNSKEHSAHIIDRVVYMSGSLSIVGWVMRPRGNGPYPVLIYNHGSRIGADGSDLDTPTLSFETRAWPGVEAGQCAVFFPEGRGYGGSDGPRLTDCKTYEDVVDFLFGRAEDVSAGRSWLGTQDWADTNRIAIAGCSHGAAVSILAAVMDSYDHVVAQAPGLFEGNMDAGLSALCEAVHSTEARLLFQHAYDDRRCPISNSEILYDAAARSGRKAAFIPYPPVPCIEGHAQFDWTNRFIWGADFDRALAPIFGGNVIMAPDHAVTLN